MTYGEIAKRLRISIMLVYRIEAQALTKLRLWMGAPYRPTPTYLRTLNGSRKPYRCGGCGRTGHTRRTCKGRIFMRSNGKRYR